MTSPGPKFQYQVSPIILTGGLAANMGTYALPMMNLIGEGYIPGNPISASSFGLIVSPYGTVTLDDAVGAFNVLTSGTLVNQSIGKYPFADQSVAANAMIREPLTLSLIMDSPMRGPNAWTIKQAIFSTLKLALDGHNNLGGMYTVYTPAFVYTNMVMTAMTDNSRANNSLPQNAWRFDFEKPLITIEDVQGAQNAMTSKITGQVPVNVEPVSQLRPGGPLTPFGPVTQSLLNNPVVASQANFAFTGID